jgi:hypothetical protein
LHPDNSLFVGVIIAIAGLLFVLTEISLSDLEGNNKSLYYFLGDIRRGQFGILQKMMDNLNLYLDSSVNVVAQKSCKFIP